MIIPILVHILPSALASTCVDFIAAAPVCGGACIFCVFVLVIVVDTLCAGPSAFLAFQQRNESLSGKAGVLQVILTEWVTVAVRD